MATPINYKGMDILDAPNKPGGQALSNNFRELADRIGQSNYIAIVDPTVSDDSSAGYTVGSRWINTNTNIEYVQIDDTIGSAVWIVSGAATSPAGADTQIQFNNAGSFGASSGLTYDGTTLRVNVGSALVPFELNRDSDDYIRAGSLGGNETGWYISTGGGTTEQCFIGVTSQGPVDGARFTRGVGDGEGITLGDDGNTYLSSGYNLLIQSTTASTSTTTGALIVSGGAAFGSDIWITNEVQIGDNNGGDNDDGFIKFNANGGSSARRWSVGSDGTNLNIGTDVNNNVMVFNDDPNDTITIQTGWTLNTDSIVVNNLVGTAVNYLGIDGSGKIVDSGISVANPVNGSGASNQVTFWQDTDTLTSNSNLTYDGATLEVDGNIWLSNDGTGNFLAFGGDGSGIGLTQTKAQLSDDGPNGIFHVVDNDNHKVIQFGSAALNLHNTGGSDATNYSLLFRDSSSIGNGGTDRGASQAGIFRAGIRPSDGAAFFGGTSSSTSYTSNAVSILFNTASTSATTGALIVTGGVGIAGNLYGGGQAVFSSSFAGASSDALLEVSNTANTGSNLNRGMIVDVAGNSIALEVTGSANLTNQTLVKFTHTNAPTGSGDGKAFAVAATALGGFDTGLFYSNGTYGIGPGSASRDIFIKRSAANTIEISDAFGTGGTSGNLIVTGTIEGKYPVSTVSSSTTITRQNRIVVKQITTSGITTTLWASPQDGDNITIINRSGGSNTIGGNGVNIEGLANYPIDNEETLRLIYLDSEWSLV